MDWVSPNLVQILGLFGVMGIGGVATKIIDRLLQHQRDKRKQTDDVAIALIPSLQQRITDLEANRARDHELCEAQLSAMRLELRQELTFSDTLVLAIRHAPDKALEIIDDAIAMRQERRAEERRTALAAFRLAAAAKQVDDPELRKRYPGYFEVAASGDGNDSAATRARQNENES